MPVGRRGLCFCKRIYFFCLLLCCCFFVFFCFLRVFLCFWVVLRVLEYCYWYSSTYSSTMVVLVGTSTLVLEYYHGTY